MVYIEEYERRKSIYRYSDRIYRYTYIMEKFAEILLSLTQPTTAAGAYIDNQFNWTSFFGWLLELGLVGGAFGLSFNDFPWNGGTVASTTTIFILIRLIVVFISVVLNLVPNLVLTYDKLWRFVYSMVETASAVLPVVGLSMMEATDNDEIDTCNNNQWIIHGFLIGSLAVRLGRTFYVLDRNPYNKLNNGPPIKTDSDERWRQRKANYASIRSKAKEEVTYNFQSSGVQRHDLI